jgi:hypothetical protein
MTVRESFGGPWGTHWALWAGLFVPTLFSVFVQEVSTGYPAWWWPLVSGILQNLVVGLVVLGGGGLARHRFAILPLTVFAALWITALLLRAVVGGALAATVAGSEPEYLWRAGVLLVGTFLWIPLLVYTAAQLDRRRLLLGALDESARTLDQQRHTARATGAEVRDSLVTAVRESLHPALDDLVASLEASRERLSATAVAELSMRVSQLHDRATDLLEPTPHRDVEPVPTRSTVRQAFAVRPRRPWLIAFLTALATISATLPDVWRLFGGLAALELTISIIAAGVMIGLVPWLVLTFAPQHSIARDQRVTVLACSVGIGVAITLMLNSGIDPITQNGLTVVSLVTVTLSIACALIVGAIVLADANREVEEKLLANTQQGRSEESTHSALVDRERRRLADLMHGPVHGRLAACVMALNFATAAAQTNTTSSATDENLPVDPALVDSIFEHLRAASRDLSAIAAREGPDAP